MKIYMHARNAKMDYGGPIVCGSWQVYSLGFMVELRPQNGGIWRQDWCFRCRRFSGFQNKVSVQV